MCALIAQILASPLADSNPHIGGILAILELICLLVGATYVGNKKLVRFVVLPLTAIWIIFRALEAVENSHPIYSHLAPIAGLALSCSILWVLLDRFNSALRISTNLISEAFISYIFIATAFSQLYLILNRILDHPFNVIVPAAKTTTMLCFSMVTLSCLGDSSMFPVNAYVRLIAAFESMSGIFYIAVVVARLVSSYRPGAQRNGAQVENMQ